MYKRQDQDLALLAYAGQHIATALERTRLLVDTRQRNAELALINSMQIALAAELNIQDIYDAVGDKIREITTVLHGAANGAMPAWRQLSDTELAAVITYTRNAFGNKAEDGIVQPKEVLAARGLSLGMKLENWPPAGVQHGMLG